MLWYAMTSQFGQRRKTRSFDLQASRTMQFLRENGTVQKFDLMDLLGMSVSTFEKFKPWFLYKFGIAKNDSEYVNYNYSSQEFTYHKIEE